MVAVWASHSLPHSWVVVEVVVDSLHWSTCAVYKYSCRTDRQIFTPELVNSVSLTLSC